MTRQQTLLDVLEDENIVDDTEVKTTVGQIRNVLMAALELPLVTAISNARKDNAGVNLYPQNQQPRLPTNTIKESWFWFLMEVEIAKLSNSLVIAESISATTVIADLLLPALLLVKLLSVLDEALTHFMAQNRLKPKGRYPSLHDKLQLLHAQGDINYSQRLKDIRELRNKVGHQPTTPANWQSGQVSWSELEQYINDVEQVLQCLQLVGKRPDYQGFSRRECRENPPEKPHVRIVRTYHYGLTEGEKTIVEFYHSWEYDRIKSRHLRSDSSSDLLIGTTQEEDL